MCLTGSLSGMIRFKNRAGFTLIDVMIAITIVGLVIPPALSFQFSIMRQVNQVLAQYRRLLLANNLFVEMHMEQKIKPGQTEVQKKEGAPPTILNYVLKSAKDNPQLKKFPSLYFEYIKISAPESPKIDTLATLVFRPQQVQKEKK
jgi:type II secretory pathway pseudopilin PulG